MLNSKFLIPLSLFVLVSTVSAAFLAIDVDHPDYFTQLIDRGHMDGYFSMRQIELIVHDFRRKYPEMFLPVEVIGNTFEKRPIKMHCLTRKESESSTLKQESASKTIALLTALTHGREPLSLSTLMFLLHKMLTEYQNGNAEYVSLLNNNIVCFVPALNIDAYEKTFQVYQEKKKFFAIRRNRNDGIKCDKFGFYGVDLNRNFDYCWNIQNAGSSDDPCEYNYRGVAAFSEPETQALKSFVEEYQSSLKVVVNIHCYGEIWILPFTCTAEKSPFDTPRVKSIYADFRRNAPIEDKDTIGSTMQLLKYTTTGDASDWILGRHGIITMTPEVGKMDTVSGRQYFPRRHFIMPAIRKAAPGIFYMVSKLNANFENHGVQIDQSGSRSNHTNIYLNLMYKSYRDLIEGEMTIVLNVQDVQDAAYIQDVLPNISVFEREMGEMSLKLAGNVTEENLQKIYDPDTRSIQFIATQNMTFKSWSLLRYMIQIPYLNYKSASFDISISERGSSVFQVKREFQGLKYTGGMDGCPESIIA